MGWFTRTSPLPVPVYSELGEEVYRLLEEREGEWEVLDGWNGNRRDGIGHRQSNLFIAVWEERRTKGIYIQQGGDGTPLISRLMTPDDLKRIERKARRVMAEQMKYQHYEQMKMALELLKPNPFDADTRSLARAVLSGDASAARPLIDKCLEQLQEGV